MAVHYDHIGTNEDGTPRFHIWSDDPDAQHLVLTGPIVGPVSTSDGVIDVSAPVVALPTPEAAMEVAEAIAERYVAEGHPDFHRDPDKDSFGFVHQRQDGTLVANASIGEAALVEAAALHGVDPEQIEKVG